MNLPSNLKYTKSHMWVKVEDDVWVIGITDTAQGMLGDLVLVSNVNIGDALITGYIAGQVESRNTTLNIYAPADGEIVAFNEELKATPELLNNTPYETWIFKFKPNNPNDINTLLDATTYQSTSETAHKTNQLIHVSQLAVIFSIISSILSCVFFYKGYDKVTNYYDNRYVGGDAYNFIINSNYSTSFFVLAVGFMLAGLLSIIIYYLSKQTTKCNLTE